MTTYKIGFEVSATIYVTVEAESANEAKPLASWEAEAPVLCDDCGKLLRNLELVFHAESPFVEEIS